MKLKNDTSFKNLSNKTLNKLNNVKMNCKPLESFDYVFTIFSEAKDNNEINEDDIWRLTAKSFFDINEMSLISKESK